MTTAGFGSLLPHPTTEGRVPDELIVLSHLRWRFVWQRPQHLVSRLARGRSVWFVEEPLPVEGLVEPRLRTARHDGIVRVWLEVPGPPRHVCFSDPVADGYELLLADLVGRHHDRAVWLYTPMALPLARAVDPRLVVYDVMDDLSSFSVGSPELALRQSELLELADVVFTGGRSLQRSVVARRPDAHCFPSGVDTDHYAAAAALRRPRSRRVAGYVGVVDERLDLQLVADLAAALPDWEIQMVGPVLKIDEASLPRAPNIVCTGQVRYEDLPRVMAGFDVALMPFALNEATVSISPTKTLEYLAAGLPVVSTRIPDVVSAFSDVVDLQADATGFAAACRKVAADPLASRESKVRPVLECHHWDTIAARMAELIAQAAGQETRTAWEART